jgi:eukaryotic translation initiation factor 2C
MSIKDKLAVDGTPLQMDKPVPLPFPNPMPSNKVETEVFAKILEGLEGLDWQAEFPLRQALATPTTSVYTNNFVITLNQDTPLYEYNITGLPVKASKSTARTLLKEAINHLPFLKDNQDKFTTDYHKKLISWVKLPHLPSVGVRSAEWKPTMDIGFHYIGPVDTDLLLRYTEGKVIPTQVCVTVAIGYLQVFVVYMTLTSNRTLICESSESVKLSTWSFPLALIEARFPSRATSSSSPVGIPI